MDFGGTDTNSDHVAKGAHVTNQVAEHKDWKPGAMAGAAAAIKASEAYL